ncbi:hypothetical protein SARC_08122 [Sphaeroforma arctica JP610]|uniref:Uncharacterized protein n=1 Tax=Sphaeroforma arctica JP610 TaxID=667725 RepID=A0A0L0FS08_9EUKA|nr:hypothetical protein SARC_08122 [Sphaeroforma arctica JP610]KNC79489.1 hypothetical protein SARC_08122 [Sphaeroforma arctica JP610]|eukprot:XP_014153391.1 hypothetical protein SARC_08122 [Sphaeroforma arctica JP610]
MRVLNSDYLYRGTVTKVVEEVCRTLVTQSIAHSLYTPALEEMPVYYQGQTIAVLVPDDDPLAPASMLATGVAGAIGGVLLNPIEVIHTRMVLQRNVSDAKYQNILQGLALVYDEEGLEGLFAGWQLAAIAHGVLPVLSDIGDSLLAELFEGVYGDDGVSSVGYVLCDILYNLAVLQIQMPLEVMRRRLYVQGALKHGFHPVTKVTRTAYTSTADIATRIYAEEGVSTFFSGFATHFAAATGAIVLYIGLQLAGE